MQIEIIIVIILLGIIIILLFLFRPKEQNNTAVLTARIDSLQSGLKEDFLMNRTETNALSKENRTELNETLIDFKKELTQTLALITQQNQQMLQQVIKTIDDSSRANRESLATNLKDFIFEQKNKFDDLRNAQKEISAGTLEQLEKISNHTEIKLSALTQQAKEDSQLMRDALENTFRNFGDTFDKSVQSFNNLQKEKFDQLDRKQTIMIESNEKKLEEMRVTVDEKLQKTLNERLGQSFEIVGKQLESVQKGLGEMQALAQDVGGLKKVLSNVKMRGDVYKRQ